MLDTERPFSVGKMHSRHFSFKVSLGSFSLVKENLRASLGTTIFGSQRASPRRGKEES